MLCSVDYPAHKRYVYSNDMIGGVEHDASFDSNYFNIYEQDKFHATCKLS